MSPIGRQRWAYADNSPLVFVDPSGLYAGSLCDGQPCDSYGSGDNSGSSDGGSIGCTDGCAGGGVCYDCGSGPVYDPGGAAGPTPSPAGLGGPASTPAGGAIAGVSDPNFETVGPQIARPGIGLAPAIDAIYVPVSEMGSAFDLFSSAQVFMTVGTPPTSLRGWGNCFGFCVSTEMGFGSTDTCFGLGLTSCVGPSIRSGESFTGSSEPTGAFCSCTVSPPELSGTLCFCTGSGNASNLRTLNDGAEEAAQGVGPDEELTPVEPYEVGYVDDLRARSRPGDDLDIHHVPQKQPADQVLPGYNGDSGTGIALPSDEHEAIPASRGAYEGDPHALVERDLENLRTYTNAPQEAIDRLRDLIIKTYF